MFHVRPVKQMKVEESGFTFTSKHLKGVETPHNDPLVEILLVGNHNIHQNSGGFWCNLQPYVLQHFEINWPHPGPLGNFEYHAGWFLGRKS